MERLWLLWHTNPSLNPRQPPFCSGRYFLSLGFLISNGVWGWEWVIQPPPPRPRPRAFEKFQWDPVIAAATLPLGLAEGLGIDDTCTWTVAEAPRLHGTRGCVGQSHLPGLPEQKRPATGAWFPWLFSRSFRAALCLSTSCPSCAKLLEWIGEVKIQGDVCVARWVSYFDWSRNVCLEIFFSYLLRSN